ncbi:MAG: ubiquinol-cytochrome c reductase iron-sulfur subunit [Tepidisphaerales bacterium]
MRWYPFTRRNLNLALAVGWGALVFCGVAAVAMVQDFLAPKVGREPRRIWRVGRFEEFTAPGLVYERFKRTPAGEPGFWIVNLAPAQNRIVALSTVCTHLGCIPDWIKGDARFKCPCHGSGFHVSGINFEGPAPRPLERFGIFRDADGYVVVDMSRVYRQELAQWDTPGSYLTVA